MLKLKWFTNDLTEEEKIFIAQVRGDPYGEHIHLGRRYRATEISDSFEIRGNSVTITLLPTGVVRK